MSKDRPGAVISLPSLGRPYGGLLPDGKLTVYAMKTTEEKLFGGLGKRSDIENVLDILIRKCSDLPDALAPKDLYIGDRLYAWLGIRAASYGAQYAFQVSCKSCRHKWQHKLENLLEDLEVQEPGLDHEDPFDLELPQSGDVVTLRLLRGVHERLIMDYVERSTKKLNTNVPGDPGYIYRHALHVVAVKSATPGQSFGGPDMPIKAVVGPAMEWFENLYAQDSDVIRQELMARTPGVNLEMVIECPKCREDNETVLPMTADFFRSGPDYEPGSRTTTRTVSRVQR